MAGVPESVHNGVVLSGSGSGGSDSVWWIPMVKGSRS